MRSDISCRRNLRATTAHSERVRASRGESDAEHLIVGFVVGDHDFDRTLIRLYSDGNAEAVAARWVREFDRRCSSVPGAAREAAGSNVPWAISPEKPKAIGRVGPIERGSRPGSVVFRQANRFLGRPKARRPRLEGSGPPVPGDPVKDRGPGLAGNYHREFRVVSRGPVDVGAKDCPLHSSVGTSA